MVSMTTPPPPKEPERLVLDVWPGAVDAEAGRWLAALDEIRRDTNRVLDEIDPAAIDADLGDGGDTLGTVLYHIALVEVDWVYFGHPRSRGRHPA